MIDLRSAPLERPLNLLAAQMDDNESSVEQLIESTVLATEVDLDSLPLVSGNLDRVHSKRRIIRDDQYFCQICLGIHALSEGHTLNCGHTYCSDCLIRYLSVRICDGDTQPKCFHPLGDTAPYVVGSTNSSFSNEGFNEYGEYFEEGDVASFEDLDLKEKNSSSDDEINDLGISRSTTLGTENGGNCDIHRSDSEAISNVSTENQSVFCRPCARVYSESEKDLEKRTDINKNRNLQENNSYAKPGQIIRVNSTSSSNFDGVSSFLLNHENDRLPPEYTFEDLSLKLDSLRVQGPLTYRSDSYAENCSYNSIGKVVGYDVGECVPCEKRVRSKRRGGSGDGINNSNTIKPTNCTTANTIQNHNTEEDSMSNNDNNIKRQESISTTSSSQAMCDAIISSDEIRSIIQEDVELTEKFEYFKFTKENKNARECPSCQYLQIGFPESPNMICGKCGDIYCFFHSKAHPNSTCDEYETLFLAENAKNIQFINTFSKSCPGCNLSIEKSGGCNHIKCIQCGTSFCWLCGQAIQDGIFPNHFQWWNMSRCSNLQMNDSIEAPSCFSRAVAITVSAFQFLIIGPIATVSTIASLCVCCCCVPLHLISAAHNGISIRSTVRKMLSDLLSGWCLVYTILFSLLSMACLLTIVMIGYLVYAVFRVLCAGEIPLPRCITDRLKLYARRCCCLCPMFNREHPPDSTSVKEKVSVVDESVSLHTPPSGTISFPEVSLMAIPHIRCSSDIIVTLIPPSDTIPHQTKDADSPTEIYPGYLVPSKRALLAVAEDYEALDQNSSFKYDKKNRDIECGGGFTDFIGHSELKKLITAKRQQPPRKSENIMSHQNLTDSVNFTEKNDDDALSKSHQFNFVDLENGSAGSSVRDDTEKNGEAKIENQIENENKNENSENEDEECFGISGVYNSEIDNQTANV